MSMWGKKSVFPAQRDDEGDVKVSREAWDQLQQMLGGLQESVKRLEKRRVGGVTAPAQAPATLPIRPHKPEVDFSDLPDPIQDKEGFLREASKRVQTQLDTMAATMKAGDEDKARAMRDAQVLNTRVNALWSKWQKGHGKKFPRAHKLIEIEAAKMVQEGIAMGLPADAVMFQDEEGFLDDLAERVGGALEELGVSTDDRDPQEVADGVDRGLDRFSGMFTGMDDHDRAGDLRAGDTGSLTPRKKGSTAEKPMNLTDQLLEAQEGMGLL